MRLGGCGRWRERERKCSATKADRTEKPSRFFNLRTPRTSGEGGNGNRKGRKGRRRDTKTASEISDLDSHIKCACLARAMRVKIGWVG